MATKHLAPGKKKKKPPPASKASRVKPKSAHRDLADTGKTRNKDTRRDMRDKH
jgi:hypothetical protein